MKKKIISALLASALLSSNALAYDINLYFDIGAVTAELNVQTIEAPSYLSELGNTMVGLRVAAETIGASVEWNEETRTVKLSDEGLDMLVTIDSDTALINGAPVKMTEPAVIYNDRTMVPIRFISEGFGATVDYIDETKSVIVSSNSYEERCRLLTQSALTLKKEYPEALRSWLAVTDEEVSAADFAAVWNSLVNTEIMELLPGRAVTNEICDRYREASAVRFDDMFSVSGVRTMNEKITTLMTVIVKGECPEYAQFTYTPSTKKIKENKAIGVTGGFWDSSSSGGGGGGTSVAPTLEPTLEPTSNPGVDAEATTEPTKTPEPTRKPGSSGGGSAGGVVVPATPTADPTASPTLRPTAIPTAIPTIVPTMVPTAVPTQRPTAEATALPTDIPQVPGAPIPTNAPVEEPASTEVPGPSNVPATREPIATDEPDMAPESTKAPGEGEAPPIATEEPTMMPTMEPTPEPTPQITDGPEGDDDHFDNVIDGTAKEEMSLFMSAPELTYVPWKAEFKIMPYRRIYSVWRR